MQENYFYPISFLVVRFFLPNGAYETVITSLSAADFPSGVEALIHKNILPIRPIRSGQKNTRKIGWKSVVSFVYRAA
ncbi:hypothetical protein NSS79_01150 [Paenibacillus sp. FSL L8-0436]|uniref:hypothetical protein n=1 Tax=Paenibacillus sp. FSL L8-0436 TaxID=2954686 RepID=UPI003157FDF3